MTLDPHKQEHVSLRPSCQICAERELMEQQDRGLVPSRGKCRLVSTQATLASQVRICYSYPCSCWRIPGTWGCNGPAAEATQLCPSPSLAFEKCVIIRLQRLVL